MAKACPCGCSVKVGWGRRKAVVHAVDLKAASPILHRFVALNDELRLGVPGATAFVSSYDTEASLLLAYGHGTLTDMSLIRGSGERRQMQLLANELIGRLNEVDPEWLTQYIATLGPIHQTQVRGSIAYYEASLAADREPWSN